MPHHPLPFPSLSCLMPLPATPHFPPFLCLPTTLSYAFCSLLLPTPFYLPFPVPAHCPCLVLLMLLHWNVLCTLFVAALLFAARTLHTFTCRFAFVFFAFCTTPFYLLCTVLHALFKLLPLQLGIAPAYLFNTHTPFCCFSCTHYTPPFPT